MGGEGAEAATLDIKNYTIHTPEGDGRAVTAADAMPCSGARQWSS
jgi:hypothetical protein